MYGWTRRVCGYGFENAGFASVFPDCGISNNVLWGPQSAGKNEAVNDYEQAVITSERAPSCRVRQVVPVRKRKCNKSHVRGIPGLVFHPRTEKRGKLRKRKGSKHTNNYWLTEYQYPSNTQTHVVWCVPNPYGYREVRPRNSRQPSNPSHPLRSRA